MNWKIVASLVTRPELEVRANGAKWFQPTEEAIVIGF
jgi:hypothetical protein